MSKKRMTTWVPTIVMGVVAILFSVYALQEQTELQRAQKEITQLKADLSACQKQLADEKGRADAIVDQALKAAQAALAEAETQYRRALKLEESKKNKR